MKFVRYGGGPTALDVPPVNFEASLHKRQLWVSVVLVSATSVIGALFSVPSIQAGGGPRPASLQFPPHPLLCAPFQIRNCISCVSFQCLNGYLESEFMLGAS